MLSKLEKNKKKIMNPAPGLEDILPRLFSKRTSQKNIYEANKYEKELFKVLSSARNDPKETLKKFSSIYFSRFVPSISLVSYSEKISSPDADYAFLNFYSALSFLSKKNVEIISFHPSCLGNGTSPVSVYTKIDNTRKLDMIIKNSSLHH